MSSSPTRLDNTTGLAMILPGIALVILGPRFDGFVKGMLLGAGIALILIGVYLLAARRRRPNDDPDQMWLPSRDQGES